MQSVQSPGGTVKRFVVPFVALLAAALIGGVASVGLWEAVDDDTAPAAATATATVNRPVAVKSGSVADIYEQTIPGVVEITAQSAATGQPGGGGTATGSGWVIDSEGHIVTNQHVVDGASEVTVKFHDGTEIQAARGRHRSVERRRAAEAQRDPRRPAAARARLVREPPDRRPGRRDRQPVRPRGHRHRRHRVGARTASSRRRTATRSTARSRPTPPSTTATRAARCSTSKAAWSG